MKPEELLHHSDFVSRLARGLVRDEHLAADISQETLTAALAHPPEAGQSFRAWLSRVARNFRSKQLRGEKRRWRREGEAAVPDIVPPTEEIVEREEIRRKVVRAVLALKEPYRSTILLRFYEDMPPRMIAKHFEVPVETVRTRVKKGLDLLRGHLDIDHGGDRKRWCLALAPAAGLKLPASSAAATTLVPGALAMTMKWKVAIAAALFLGITFGVWKITTKEDEAIRNEPALSDSRSASPFVPKTSDQVQEPDQSEKTGILGAGGKLQSRPDSRRVPVAPRGAWLAGIVRDESGRTISKARVFLEERGSEPRKVAESDEDGSFEADRLPSGSCLVFAEAGNGLRSPRQKVELSAGTPVYLELEVGAWLEIWGKVSSALDGKPIAGARVASSGVGDLERREVLSDEEGRYRLEGLTRTTFLLEVSAKGYGTELREGIPSGSSNVDFELSRPGVLKGIVRDASTGGPVTNFRIELVPEEYHFIAVGGTARSVESMFRLLYYKQHRDFHMVRSFESQDGSFEFIDLARGRYHMAAAAKGYAISAAAQPVSIESDQYTYSEIALSLAGSIRGRVMDAERELPIQGACVKTMGRGIAAAGFSILDERSASTDWDGRFDFRNTSRGTIILEITHPDYTPKMAAVVLRDGALFLGKGKQEGVSLDDGGLAIRLDARQEPGRIAVTVGGDLRSIGDSPPLIAVMGFVHNEVAVPGEHGNFVSGPLDPGPFNVLLIVGGGIAGNKPAEVKPGDVTSVFFGIDESGASIRCSVYAGMDLHKGGGFATLVVPGEKGNQPVSTVQFEGGAFHMSGLKPGSGELQIILLNGSGYGFAYSKKIAWEGNDRLNFELRLPEAGLNVRVLDGNFGSVIPGAKVEAKRMPSLGRTGGWEFKGGLAGFTDEEGFALLKHVPEGAYSIRVTSEGYSPHEEELEISGSHVIDLITILSREDG